MRWPYFMMHYVTDAINAIWNQTPVYRWCTSKIVYGMFQILAHPEKKGRTYTIAIFQFIFILCCICSGARSIAWQIFDLSESNTYNILPCRFFTFLQIFEFLSLSLMLRSSLLLLPHLTRFSYYLQSPAGIYDSAKWKSSPTGVQCDSNVIHSRRIGRQTNKVCARIEGDLSTGQPTEYWWVLGSFLRFDLLHKMYIGLFILCVFCNISDCVSLLLADTFLFRKYLLIVRFCIFTAIVIQLMHGHRFSTIPKPGTIGIGSQNMTWTNWWIWWWTMCAITILTEECNRQHRRKRQTRVIQNTKKKKKMHGIANALI